MLLTLGLTALLLTAAACGGGDGDDTGGDDRGETATEAADDSGDDDGGGEVSFDVSMTDNKFAPGDFIIPAGATVTFNLTNDGAAIHAMRVAGADNEYNTGDDAVSGPDLISGAGTGTLEWTAPDSPGEIKLQCDFHPTDMLGTITVE